MAWNRNRPLGLVYRDASLCHDGYTLFSSVEGYHATLIDSLGRIVHRWTHDEGIQYAQLLPSGHLLLHTAPPSHTVEPEEVSPVGVVGGAAHALIDWRGEVRRLVADVRSGRLRGHRPLIGALAALVLVDRNDLGTVAEQIGQSESERTRPCTDVGPHTTGAHDASAQEID